MVELTGYDGFGVRGHMDAREYFEGVRSAVRARERCRRRIEAMRAAEGLRGASLSALPSGGGVSDPMRRTDARIDAEALAMRELAQYDGIIADGFTVCAGVRAANPSQRWGDALEARFCLDSTWELAARILEVTRQQAQRDADAGLDWVDLVGIAAAREGCGQASLF